MTLVCEAADDSFKKLCCKGEERESKLYRLELRNPVSGILLGFGNIAGREGELEGLREGGCN